MTIQEAAHDLLARRRVSSMTRLMLLMWAVLAAVPRASAAPLTGSFECPLIAPHLMSASCRATLLTSVSTASSPMKVGVADVGSSLAADVLAWTGGVTLGEPLHIQFSMAPGRPADGPIAELHTATLRTGVNLHGVDDCSATSTYGVPPEWPAEPVPEPAMLLIAGASGLGFRVRRRRRLLGLGLIKTDSFLDRSQRKEAVRPASIVPTCSAVNRASSVAPLRI